MKRYLESTIYEDIQDKMVFIGGPRQVGKTTLSKNISNLYQNSKYYNWDTASHRQLLMKEQFPLSSKLIILDEIHKYKHWKNYVKGLFDTRKDEFQILVTGSARLDLYQKGGDSLMGRYHYHRLHPLSLAELCNHQYDFSNFSIDSKLIFSTNNKAPEILDKIMQFGTFPEPYLKANTIKLQRWQNERKTRLIKEDIRDISFIKELSQFQQFMDILPNKVSSTLSINSLREDLQVSHHTLSAWLEISDSFYYSYRLSPFSFSTIKALKKEKKLYLWDFSELTNEGAKFENLIASHLLKFTHFLYDTYGIKAKLHYLRDKEQREVDFCLAINNEPYMIVEAKLSDEKTSKHLQYFHKKLNPKYSFQVIRKEGVDYTQNGIIHLSASKFLQAFV